MNPFNVVNGDDEQFSLLLAHYSEVLRVGDDADPASNPTLSAQMRQRLQRALNCLRLLRQLGPELPQSDAVTWVVAKGSTQQDDLVGGQLGRFHVLRLLGHGGGGIVYLAFDPDLRREVALKIPLLPALLAPDMGRRFLREAQAAAQLDHPNLVPVHEVAESNGRCFLVLAYCRGGNLSQWLAARTSPVPVCQAAEWLAELADAVQYVHTHGIYHRDIKPGNILLGPRNDPSSGKEILVPRLSDFGLAKVREAEAESTRSGTLLGTLSYMAPEQVEGRLRDIGPATDVYGLGAVLYEMLTGRPPFRGATDTDTLRQVLEDDPAPPRRLHPDLPSDLQTICLKCLEKQPVRRYGSAAQLADDLRRFLAHEPIAARPIRRLEHLRKWCRRRPTKTVLLASSLLIVLILGIGWLRLASLEQARDADQETTKRDKERQKTIRDKEQRLSYAADIARAWHSWENRRPDDMANLLNNYRPSSDPDNAEDIRGFEWYYLSRLARTQPRKMFEPGVFCLAFSPDGALLCN